MLDWSETHKFHSSHSYTRYSQDLNIHTSEGTYIFNHTTYKHYIFLPAAVKDIYFSCTRLGILHSGKFYIAHWHHCVWSLRRFPVKASVQSPTETQFRIGFKGDAELMLFLSYSYQLCWVYPLTWFPGSHVQFFFVWFMGKLMSTAPFLSLFHIHGGNYCSSRQWCEIKSFIRDSLNVFCLEFQCVAMRRICHVFTYD